MNLKIKICLILACISVCFIIAGCKDTQIKFAPESKFQKFMRNEVYNNNKGTVYKSSGVVIYKTKEDKENNGSDMQFGPKDFSFDLPLKF